MSSILKAAQRELNRHSWGHFVDNPPSIAQGDKGVVVPAMMMRQVSNRGSRKKPVSTSSTAHLFSGRDRNGERINHISTFPPAFKAQTPNHTTHSF
jgi:hypothetical protein